MEAREDLLQLIRSPMGPELEEDDSWERGRQRLRVQRKQSILGNCRKLSVVRKFDDWTQRELNLGRFHLVIVLREKKEIEGILNVIILLFKNIYSGYRV